MALMTFRLLLKTRRYKEAAQRRLTEKHLADRRLVDSDTILSCRRDDGVVAVDKTLRR